MPDWKTIEKLAGESVREIGILVLVFAPLDAFFASERTDLDLILIIAGWALGVIVAGIMLEAGD